MVTHAPPVRVALVGLERMLGEIVEDAVLSDEGMALVEPDAPATPDAVVVRSPGGSADVGALLDRWPHAKVFAIAADGRRVTLHQLVPDRMALGELAGPDLVRAIRTAVVVGRREESDG